MNINYYIKHFSLSGMNSCDLELTAKTTVGADAGKATVTEGRLYRTTLFPRRRRSNFLDQTQPDPQVK